MIAQPGTLPERLPVVGELVVVRSRRWLVEEVIESARAGDSARVRLACADDDNQGASLEVFWDYELDRRIVEDEAWRDLAAKGFEAPRTFSAFLNTLRWSCVTATDPNIFQAPFRAGIKIDAYQMEPLRKALRLPRVNLFIADDTGLGHFGASWAGSNRVPDTRESRAQEHILLHQPPQVQRKQLRIQAE